MKSIEMRAARAAKVRSMRPFLTCADVARVLQCSVRAVQMIAKRGEFATLEIAEGGPTGRKHSYRIDPYSFDRWVAAHTKGAVS